MLTRASYPTRAVGGADCPLRGGAATGLPADVGVLGDGPSDASSPVRHRAGGRRLRGGPGRRWRPLVADRRRRQRVGWSRRPMSHAAPAVRAPRSRRAAAQVAVVGDDEQPGQALHADRGTGLVDERQQQRHRRCAGRRDGRSAPRRSVRRACPRSGMPSKTSSMRDRRRDDAAQLADEGRLRGGVGRAARGRTAGSSRRRAGGPCRSAGRAGGWPRPHRTRRGGRPLRSGRESPAARRPRRRRLSRIRARPGRRRRPHGSRRARR